MEKLQFLLLGREFDVITDHKAIEKIQMQKEFGTPRITRWIDRINQFQFKVKYIPGNELHNADVMSRSIENSDTNIENEHVNKILRIHKELSHRKNISKNLEEQSVIVTKKDLKRILESCKICNEFDKKIKSKFSFIKTNNVGERAGCDILEIKKGKLILNLIDYFSRKVFSQKIRSKTPDEIIKFMNKVYDEFKFKSMITDNGKEFENKYVKKWCAEKNVKHTFSIPYYHASNGRIERLNRTIRTALKKVKGKGKLKKIVDAYNSTIHRGIGISPDKAILIENKNLVLKNQLKTKKSLLGPLIRKAMIFLI
ncbi:putative uncharacterized transposon-derived protein F54H12.3 [Dictyocoela muelleri]|nr:putative uncharacterized transposon-derived protein F54H12.3 [Dictyocoela muelleri]